MAASDVSVCNGSGSVVVEGAVVDVVVLVVTVVAVVLVNDVGGTVVDGAAVVGADVGGGSVVVDKLGEAVVGRRIVDLDVVDVVGETEGAVVRGIVLGRLVPVVLLELGGKTCDVSAVVEIVTFDVGGVAAADAVSGSASDELVSFRFGAEDGADGELAVSEGVVPLVCVAGLVDGDRPSWRFAHVDLSGSVAVDGGCELGEPGSTKPTGSTLSRLTVSGSGDCVHPTTTNPANSILTAVFIPIMLRVGRNQTVDIGGATLEHRTGFEPVCTRFAGEPFRPLRHRCKHYSAQAS